VYDQAKEGNCVTEVARTSSVWCEVGNVGSGGLCGCIDVTTGDQECGVWSRQSEENRMRRGGSPVMKSTEGISTILLGGGEHFMPLRE
jgi:hypothetical protein